MNWPESRSEPRLDQTPGVADMANWATSNGWDIWRSQGSAEDFHGLDSEPLSPGATKSSLFGTGSRDHGQLNQQVWIRRIPIPALVLGSTQIGPDKDGCIVDAPLARELGYEVCQRRSGGGLVLIQPSDVWIDLLVGRNSPLWDDDVGRSFHWLGQHWRRVLQQHLLTTGDGLTTDRAHPSPEIVVADSPDRSDIGRLYCFAGRGHGEIYVGQNKVMGLSQRRTKSWSRIQSLLVGSAESSLAFHINHLNSHGVFVDPTLKTAATNTSVGLPPNSTLSDQQELINTFLKMLPGA